MKLAKNKGEGGLNVGYRADPNEIFEEDLICFERNDLFLRY